MLRAQAMTPPMPPIRPQRSAILSPLAFRSRAARLGRSHFYSSTSIFYREARVHAARPRVESASSLFTSPSPVSSTSNSLSPTACFIYILSFSLSLSPSVVLSSSSTTRDRKIHPHRTSASFSPPLNRASIVHFNDFVLVSHLLTRLCLH